MRIPSLCLKASVNSFSGYGSHARDLAYALINSGKFEVEIIPIRWGILPLGALDADTPKNNAIKQCIIREFNPNKQYDYFVHLTIPNEFEKLGRTNIGFTAGVEVDRVAPIWLEKGNLMDLVIVPSNHSRMVYAHSGYTMMAKDGSVPQANLSCKVPIKVVFEGVDTSIFNEKEVSILCGHEYGEPSDSLVDHEGHLNEKINSFRVEDGQQLSYNGKIDFKTDFNFLYMGHWLNGGVGEDRKNVGKLLKCFVNAFDYNPNVGLILKTAIGSNSIPDRFRVIDRIKRTLDSIGYKLHDKSPKIYLLHGTMKDEEIAQLYKHPKIKACVTLTHGEGYGRPLAEAAACDLPVIAPDWSGQVDFLDKNLAYLIPVKMVPLPQSVVWPGVLEAGSMWSDVEEIDSIKALKDMYHEWDKYKGKAVKLGEKIRKDWNIDKMQTLLVDTILSAGSSTTSIPLGNLESAKLPFKMVR